MPRSASAAEDPAVEAEPAATPGPGALAQPALRLLPSLCPPALSCPPPLGAWTAGGSLGYPLPGASSPEGDVPVTRLEIRVDAPSPAWTRRLGSMVGVGTFYGALYTWAYFAWYRGRPQNERFLYKWEGAFGPHTYAGGADKLGHYFSSYAIARATADVLRHYGWQPWVAVLVGASMSLTWFTAIEVKDAFHKNFGFSPEDMLANTLGVLTSIAMVLFPALDNLVDVRMYYRPSKPFTDELLQKRSVDLAEDYTGSTYLVALRLMGIPWIQRTAWARPLRYIDLMVGYNARGFLPRPTNGRWRDRELFFGFGLNLVAILEEAVPGSRLHRTIDVMQEYFQLTPIARFVRARSLNEQPYRIRDAPTGGR